jgi:hypothetical protein
MTSTLADGDGASPERAIRLDGVADSLGWIAAAYDYLAAHCPKHEPRTHRLIELEGHRFGVVRVKGPQGERDVYFDASCWHGR